MNVKISFRMKRLAAAGLLTMLIVSCFSIHAFAADGDDTGKFTTPMIADRPSAETVDVYWTTIKGEASEDVKGEEDYRIWAQADPRWGGIHLGQSSYTVASSGCLVTSITKIIIQSGFRDSEDFNVATLTNWLNSHGGFSDAGNLYWVKPAQMIDGFEFADMIYEAGYSSNASYQQFLMDYVRQGYHIVLTVKNYGHYVAVDNAKSLTEGEIYIMDSLNNTASNADVTLSSRYSYVSRICLYSGWNSGEDVLPGILLGDADADGEITMDDSLSVMRYAMFLIDGDEIVVYQCDMDGDGEITVSDALDIMRIVVLG